MGKARDEMSYSKTNLFLIIILFLAFIIRVIGIYPGHPPDHPDEPMSYSSAIEMLMHGDLNPRRFDYPSGVPLLHYLFYKQFLLEAASLQVFFKEPSSIITAVVNYPVFLKEFEEIIFGKGWLHALFWSRFLTAILGVISVFLMYVIGKRLFNSATGIYASIFLAVNYRHVLSSHLALSDIPNGFFALLAFYSSILLWEKNSPARYLLCAACIGLSISMKYQIFAVLPFVFVHLLWVIKKRKITELFNRHFIFSLILIPIIFVLLNPYLLFNLKTALPIVQYVSLRYGAGAYRLNFYPLFYLYHWGIGVLPFLAIVAGFLISAIKYPIKTLLILTYVAPFLFVFLYYMTGGIYVRNFTTVMPFLMLFAGVMFGAYVDVFKRVVSKKILFLLSVLFLFIINFISIKDSFMLSFAYTKKWSREILAAWAVRNIPEGSKIINDNVGLPSSIDKPLEIIPWSSEEGNSITQLSHRNIDFAILNINWNQIYFFWFLTPYHEILLSGGIPYEKLKDSYHGLLLSEYHSYVVFETYKPWQASDHAYFVLKIPKISPVKKKELRSFHFTTDLEGWKPYDFNKSKTNMRVSWDSKVGNNANGSLLYHGSTNVQSLVRATSPFIEISPGKVYKIEGFIRPKEASKRYLQDGFLRVDFYNKNNESVLRDGKLTTAVSERTFGEPTFMEKEIVVKAPKNAMYLTISLQHSKPENIKHQWEKNTVFWVDDVKVYELDAQLIDKFPKIPYISPTVPDDVLYPNSII